MHARVLLYVRLYVGACVYMESCVYVFLPQLIILFHQDGISSYPGVCKVSVFNLVKVLSAIVICSYFMSRGFSCGDWDEMIAVCLN